jgi:hypothetical protein
MVPSFLSPTLKTEEADCSKKPSTVPVYQQHTVTLHNIFTVPTIRTSNSTHISVFIVASDLHQNNCGLKNTAQKDDKFQNVNDSDQIIQLLSTSMPLGLYPKFQFTCQTLFSFIAHSMSKFLGLEHYAT